MKRLYSIFMALMMCCGFLLSVPMQAKAATFTDINQSDVFLKQAESNSCTLCAAAMLCRRVAIMDHRDDWRSITEAQLKTVMDWNDGLSWDFTYAGIRIVHSGGKYALDGQNKAEKLRDVLSRCPEGIVAYDRDRPHAVLLTDYTDGTFYCAEPANSKDSGRISISKASITIDGIDDYWYCKSPLVNLETDAPAPVITKPEKPSVTVNASDSANPVTISYNACNNTTHYDIRFFDSGDNLVWAIGQCDDGAAFGNIVAYTDTSYSHTFPAGSYYVTVAAVNNNTAECNFSDAVSFTVTEAPKYPDKPVVTVEATDSAHPVVVSYNACSNATDYCIRYYDTSDHLVYAIGDCEDSAPYNEIADYTKTSHSHSFPAGSYKILVAAVNANDGVWTFSDSVAFSVSDLLKGDANGDGSIDLKDVTMMRRALVGWDVEINEAASDVNQDGSFDLKDVVHLRRFLAGGWGIILN